MGSAEHPSAATRTEVLLPPRRRRGEPGAAGDTSVRSWPLLMSGPMVRALLARMKEQSRRLDRRWLKVKAGDLLWVRETWCPGDRWNGCACDPPCTIRYRADGYVRTFTGPGPGEWFDTDATSWGPVAKWKSPLFMPRWASRITLRATADARLERLQDISEADARAEGVTVKGSYNACTDPCDNDAGPCACGAWHHFRYTYAQLWDRINGAGSWASNPEIVVLQFEVVAP